MMAASSSQDFVQLKSSEEGNWLSLGRALATVLCQGLRPFIKRETDAFYNNVKGARAAGPCTCVHVPGRKPNQHHDMRTCQWANVLQIYHLGRKPNWKQSDPTKWMDPNIGPWEIAKLFLPDVGSHTVIESVEDMEITNILNLMFWCNHFTVQRPLIKDVRDTRNTKWAHVPKLELSDAEKKDAFETIEKLLKDPALAGDFDAQNTLREILTLKSTKEVHIFRSEVLSHFKDAIQNDITGLKNELKTLKKESKRNRKQRSRVEGQLRNHQRALENLEKKTKGTISVTRLVTNRVLSVVSVLVRSARGIRRKSVGTFLMFLVFYCLVGILDDKSYGDGCPGEDVSVPYDTKEFNLTDYLTVARENFIGRRWLYEEIENSFHPSNTVSGVLIIGDPGAGKSALSAQLVCSRTSSRIIHEHILGYHLCKHSDKNTQIAGKFVRNLAEMIARRIPEYGYIVSNSSYILRSLNTDCVTIQDPVGCFEQAVLSPLRGLTNAPKENWYIVIDALDECLTQTETSHSIVYLLNNKLPRFPSWLKLVMTSRNESSVSLTSDSIKKLIIDPEDSRNIEDIELFLTTKFYRDGPLLHRVKAWFGDSSVENTAKLISALLSKSQGNFLFVKEMIHHWKTSRIARRDPYALPETLGELYHSYFQRLYDRQEQFKPVRRVLELLVATFHPMTQRDIFDVLKMNEQNLEEDYDFRDRMKELGHFVRYGENDTVTLYHLSLTEWLTSDSNRNGPYYVSKKKGHEVFCDFYLRLIAEGGKSALTKYILTLAQHIAYGGWREAYVNEFLSFPSQVVNSSDPESNRTLLHLAATINSTDVLELLLRHFSCIDCTDNRGITPAFLAAEHGLVDNLALMVKKGAKVNRKTKCLTSSYKLNSDDTSEIHEDDFSLTFSELKSKFWGATMLYAAAHGGHLEVVNFLLDNGAFISTVSDVHLTALQIAAENGHLEVVEALYKSGGVADQTALHHAAANNRLDVVKYLLEIGVKDKCMRCDGSFYWLKTKHRLQSHVKVAKVTVPIKKHCKSRYEGSEIRRVEGECIERENVSTSVYFGELFDDKHLIFCETALYAAVSLGHKAVVKELLSKDTWALACHDHTGRTPLHEAVRKNNTEMVTFLLMKDQAKIHSTCDHWQNLQEENENWAHLMLSHEESFEYNGDICHCGYTPLHLAARYGYWNIAIDLMKRRANVGAKDCFGATPLHVAACHNHWNIIYILLEFGADISGRTFNGSTPIHSAAACSAVEAIDDLLGHGANLSEVDDSGLTALHYTILNINSSQLDRKILVNFSTNGYSPQLVTIDRRGHLAKFYEEDNRVKNTDFYRWLDAFISLIFLGSDINAVDIHGRTALHMAAENGLADAVNVLLQRKPRLEIRDKLGKTPLEIAVEKATLIFEHPRSVIIGKSIDKLRYYLRDHEMVVYLLLSSGVSFTKCNHSGKSLLHRAVLNNQSFIAQLLLLKGASLKCKDNLGRTALVAFLQNGGDWADAVSFNASVKIKCGKPFNTSLFHLMCYYSPKLEDYNFFQHVSCDDHTCSSKKSPLVTAIERHPLKYKVIDSCLDAEGFTPLHRAAQGANLVAVRNLIKHGANVSLLSPHGHDALTLSLLHGGSNLWPLMSSEIEHFKMDEASVVAIELLRHKMKSDFQIVCNSSEAELTLYHLAASRGLITFIKEIFKDKKLHKLEIDCPNRDGITPMYLAKLFSNVVEIGQYNPWAEVIQFIVNQGGQIKYPNRDAEYNVIYNRLHGWIPKDLELNLRPDVRGFVIRLLSTYGHWPTSSMHCQIDSLSGHLMEIGFPLLTLDIGNELLQSLPKSKGCSAFVSYNVRRALKDLKNCYKKYHGVRPLWSAYNTIITKRILLKIPLALRLSTVNLGLFYLMRMWHKEVFEHFACFKLIFDIYRPFFLDESKSEQLIRLYEDSTPLWYLNNICFRLEQAFQSYLLHYSYNADYVELRKFFHEYPIFVKERMGWTVNQLSGHSGSWPLEFLVKFSLGLYRQYDYLKVLNVGLEPKTHISLYPDKLREIFKAQRENFFAD